LDWKKAAEQFPIRLYGLALVTSTSFLRKSTFRKMKLLQLQRFQMLALRQEVSSLESLAENGNSDPDEA
jgi:hypothetical protein